VDLPERILYDALLIVWEMIARLLFLLVVAVKRPAGTKAVVVAAERSNSADMEDLGSHMICSVVLIDIV